MILTGESQLLYSNTPHTVSFEVLTTLSTQIADVSDDPSAPVVGLDAKGRITHVS